MRCRALWLNGLKRNGPVSLQRYESNAAQNRDRLSVRIKSTGGISGSEKHSMTALSHLQKLLLSYVSHSPLSRGRAVVTLFNHPP